METPWYGMACLQLPHPRLDTACRSWASLHSFVESFIECLALLQPWWHRDEKTFCLGGPTVRFLWACFDSHLEQHPSVNSPLTSHPELMTDAYLRITIFIQCCFFIVFLCTWHVVSTLSVLKSIPLFNKYLLRNQFHKNKRPNQEMGQRTKQTSLQRRHTDGWQTHEKMLSITHYQRNANQNHNEVTSHTNQNGCYQKVYKQ